jgi:hypothetical protein
MDIYVYKCISIYIGLYIYMYIHIFIGSTGDEEVDDGEGLYTLYIYMYMHMYIFIYIGSTGDEEVDDGEGLYTLVAIISHIGRSFISDYYSYFLYLCLSGCLI